MQGYLHKDLIDEGFIDVSDLHKIYYAQYGKPNGRPVIYLHGGPGARTSKQDTRYFDPSVYRVVLLDQRGSGKSTPVAELRENTTQLLISDIELLRSRLGISSWDIVFGGSWGSTLSLAYAQAHPDKVRHLVLRGIFLGEEWEFDWTLRGAGAALLFPDCWETFLSHLPEDERKDPLAAYHKLLTAEDPETRLKAARSWNNWEISISNLVPPPDAFEKADDDDWNLQHARVETHYFVNGNFLRGDRALLKKENMDKIARIPAYIVQGRYDIVCPPRAAWLVHKALPQSKLYWSSMSGHSAMEPQTSERLIQICDELREQ
ncbi:prolyl aminopeptidase [Cyphellophora europaea CBS 101466]|uniref:Proline iminopeptidase n=1 Tax=Cyphellophora europaea (strain CBS 101466) TaxID=1220924 RepID=W2S6S2_CYPE1|nr:prolyl aminopeptidase [Cyphellophora europaea CBS 101466]ETN44391.1 prolyl aminopeptidase [Cyphellophora europaea CBS 101466]